MLQRVLLWADAATLAADYNQRWRTKHWTTKNFLYGREWATRENQNAKENKILRMNIKFICKWMVSRECDGIDCVSGNAGTALIFCIAAFFTKVKFRCVSQGRKEGRIARVEWCEPLGTDQPNVACESDDEHIHNNHNVRLLVTIWLSTFFHVLPLHLWADSMLRKIGAKVISDSQQM